MQKDTPTQTTAIGVSFLYEIFFEVAMYKVFLILFDENNNDLEEITITPFVDWTDREITMKLNLYKGGRYDGEI